jgi:hypothetical protein
MTVAQKVFGFFAVCLVINIGLSLAGVAPVSTYSTKEPVADMSREAQCARGDSKYIVVLSYNGSPIEKAYYRCDNNALISVSKI